MRYDRKMTPFFQSIPKHDHQRSGAEGWSSSSFCREQRGFTLIEIIAVLVLMGVVAAMAVSRSLNGTAEAEVAGAVEVVKNHLRYAQTRAMNADVSWGILFNGSTYTLQDTDTPTPNTATLPGDLPQGMTFVASVNPVMFEKRWGSPGNTTITVTVSKGGVSPRTITVTRKTGFIP